MKKIIFALLLAAGTSFAADLTTLAEKSNWKQTGNAEETQRLCLTFQKQFPKQVQCHIYGKTPENRNLHYMVVGDPKTPAVWVQAGIHAGEIDGKDAVFLLIQEILLKKIKSPLQGIHLVFIPIVNLDGHERSGKWNRPNQVGPEEMGWRTTAQNFNLNRDFMKLDAPEMRDLLKLWHKVDPILSLDLHVTNGAQFQPEVGLIILPNLNQGETALNKAAKAYELALLEKMKASNHLALPYYPSFEVDDDPLSGFGFYVSLPRFAHGYWAINNRLGMLVETHSWKDYANRVKTHHDTVLASLEIAQVEAQSWKKIEKETDNSLVTGLVDLEYKHTDKSRMIDFPGYKFTKNKSAVSGEKIIKYDPSQPENWRLPLFEELAPTLTVSAPKEGYFIQPADADWLLPKLQVHGIKFFKWTKPNPQILQVFRASKTQLSANSYEGHQTLIVEGDWVIEEISLPQGMIFVPINQAQGKLILQLLEPRSQDSYLAWGFMNRAFEQKEYMENYVAEDVAIQMLKNPEIKKEFEAKLKSDADFAKDASKRFNFFYKKHPSWDVRYNRYPIFKI
jgi:hypothetical protein